MWKNGLLAWKTYSIEHGNILVTVLWCFNCSILLFAATLKQSPCMIPSQLFQSSPETPRAATARWTISSSTSTPVLPATRCLLHPNLHLARGSVGKTMRFPCQPRRPRTKGHICRYIRNPVMITLRTWRWAIWICRQSLAHFLVSAKHNVIGRVVWFQIFYMYQFYPVS
jgi:hypothetical protein